MYYEEKIIDNILHVRTTPNSKFRALTQVELTQKLIYLRRTSTPLTAPVSELNEQ